MNGAKSSSQAPIPPPDGRGGHPDRPRGPGRSQIAWALAAALAALSCEKEALRVEVRAQCVGAAGAAASGGGGACGDGAPDGGAGGAGGASGCAAYGDVWCVNFLRFFVEVDGQELTRCVPVTSVLGKRATTFCDFERGAVKGLDLFDLSPDRMVKFSVQGLRVYPIDSCQGLEACQRPPVFRGESKRARVADLVGKAIQVAVTQCNPCGQHEAFIPNPARLACEEVCQGLQVVCQPLDGCLCKVKE